MSYKDELNIKTYVFLSSDNYSYGYIWNIDESKIMNAEFSENDNDEYYFMDFDVELRNSKDQNVINLIEYRNGNEIHFDDVVYYLNDGLINNELIPEVARILPFQLNMILSIQEIEIISSESNEKIILEEDVKATYSYVTSVFALNEPVDNSVELAFPFLLFIPS